MDGKHLLALVVGLLAIGIASGDPEHKEPQSVAASCASTSADVAWDAVEDSHLSGYDVYYRASGAPDYTKANGLPVTQTTYTVTNLSSGTPYEFRVVSVFDDSHESDMSGPATCTTS